MVRPCISASQAAGIHRRIAGRSAGLGKPADFTPVACKPGRCAGLVGAAMYLSPSDAASMRRHVLHCSAQPCTSACGFFVSPETMRVGRLTFQALRGTMLSRETGTSIAQIPVQQGLKPEPPEYEPVADATLNGQPLKLPPLGASITWRRS